MFSPSFNLNCLLILLLYNMVYSYDTDYIPDSWIDPTDMRNYDRFNKRMKSPPSNEENKTPESSMNGENCTDHAKDLKRYEIFLERFINHVLSTADLKNKVMQPKTRITSEIPVLITSEELSRLTKLSRKITAANLNELDELFSSVFTNDRGFSFDSLTPYLNPIEQLFFNLSCEKITVVVFIMLFCVVMWMFAVGRELKKILIFVYLIFFMGGLGWNWWKMYQEAVIEQYTEMQRLSQIPDVCVPKKVGFFEYIFSTSSPQEDCRRYHTAFQFNPFSKVPPTIVLSETVSGMFVYPLKALGSSVGEFLSGVNNAASWPFKFFFLPFVYITSVISLLCIVMVCLGVKLNFWTLFGGVSIGGKIQNEASSHPTVTDEISLRRTIQYDREEHYIITQVGTIRKCITAVQNEVLMEPLENKISLTSTMKRRLPTSAFFQNNRSGGEKLSYSFCDSSSANSNNDQIYIQDQVAVQHKSPAVSDLKNKNYFMPLSSHRAHVQVDKNSPAHEKESSLASGDNLLRNSEDVDQDIQNHWYNVLRQLNHNITRKVQTARILNSRSVICRKKYK